MTRHDRCSVCDRRSTILFLLKRFLFLFHRSDSARSTFFISLRTRFHTLAAMFNIIRDVCVRVCVFGLVNYYLFLTQLTIRMNHMWYFHQLTAQNVEIFRKNEKSKHVFRVLTRRVCGCAHLEAHMSLIYSPIEFHKWQTIRLLFRKYYFKFPNKLTFFWFPISHRRAQGNQRHQIRNVFKTKTKTISHSTQHFERRDA